MDMATIVKLVGVIVAVISIWKIYIEYKTSRKAYLRAEYEFARKFFSQIETENLHQYTLEKGYQAIAGTTDVKSKEIEYILTLDNPAQCLKDYILSKQMMEKIETKGNLKLKFRKKYKSNWSRVWRKFMYLCFYFAFALLAFSPLIIQSFLKSSISTMGFQLLLSAPFGGVYAWGAINAYYKISRGEYLINNQSKYTQKIIIQN